MKVKYEAPVASGLKRSVDPEAYASAAGPVSHRYKDMHATLKELHYKTRTFEPEAEKTRTIQVKDNLSRIVSPHLYEMCNLLGARTNPTNESRTITFGMSSDASHPNSRTSMLWTTLSANKPLTWRKLKENTAKNNKLRLKNNYM